MIELEREFQPKKKVRVIIYLRNNIDENLALTDIAATLKFSDVSITQILKRLRELKVVETLNGISDGRIKFVKLTKYGISLADRIKDFFNFQN